MAASTNRLCEHCKAFEFKESSFAEHFKTEIVGGEEQLSLKVGSSQYFSVPYARKGTLPELPSLRLDAELGCNCCGLLRDLIMKRLGDVSDLDAIEIDIHNARYRWNGGLDYLSISLDVCNGSGSKEIDLDVYADNEQCAHWLGIEHRRSLEEILSDEGISTINGWIKDCTHYEKCTSLPTRLIDVSGRSGLQNPRLVLTEDHAPLVPSADAWRYIALSYVWGSEPPTTTTKESFSARTTEIDFATLPQLFKDTILLSRRLGINYVWIDSLCIIQDDLDDWEKESAEMFNIYRQAYVTFIALNGESCHDGFLRRVPQPYAVIPYTLPSGITMNYGLREYKGDVRLQEEIRASKWGTRGWTFQEELFSSRKLYFGQTMFFECSKDHKQELMRIGSDPRSRNYEAIFQDYEGDACINYTEFWGSNVMQYSSRQFTKPADRLPALSSWAKFIANKANDEYLAGLWKKDLLRELHWALNWMCYEPDLSLDKFKKKLKKPGEPGYEAPSWSWCRWTSAASEFMHPPGLRRDPMCRIIEAKTEVQGKNPFGRVSGGHLIISGSLVASPGSLLVAPMTTNCDSTLLLKPDWETNNIELGSGDFGLLLLLRGWSPGCFEFTGLILLRTEIEGQYHRVGIFEESTGRGRSIFDGIEHCTVRII